MTTNDGRCLRSEVGRMRTEGGEGRDTERCGDPKIWFPMRVTYQREMKVKMLKDIRPRPAELIEFAREGGIGEMRVDNGGISKKK